MLEPSQSIKSTQSFNATQSQKVIKLESESVDQDYGEETPFATVKKKSDFLKPLIRKKRADDENE